MKSVIRLFFLFCLPCFAGAQIVQNPIVHSVENGKKEGSYYQGRLYCRWIVDINHDGINDVLISIKERPDEIEADRLNNRFFFNPDQRRFEVYIGLADGGYVANNEAVILDLSHCYVGYVAEVRSYGIVSIEERVESDPDVPEAKHGILKNQVVCYTIVGNKLKRKNLTPRFDAGDENTVYNKYLSEGKRTKVHLQEVTP